MRKVWLILLVACGMVAASIADAQRFQITIPTEVVPAPLTLQDGNSTLLLEDNSSDFCLESGC